ncbi:MAG: hypothetical protein ACF788_04515 [Novipirellula sp. JB048]
MSWMRRRTGIAVGTAAVLAGGVAAGAVPVIVGADTVSSKVEIVANLPKGAQPTKRKPVPVTVDVLMEWDRSTNDDASQELSETD